MFQLFYSVCFIPHIYKRIFNIYAYLYFSLILSNLLIYLKNILSTRSVFFLLIDTMTLARSNLVKMGLLIFGIKGPVTIAAH